jgi:hypothetical protein
MDLVREGRMDRFTTSLKGKTAASNAHLPAHVRKKSVGIWREERRYLAVNA